MNGSITKEQLKIYMWLGLVLFLVTFFGTLGNYPENFFAAVLNNIWATIYLIVVNFTLFERSIPFVIRKRSSIIFNIFLGILFLLIYLMLYSFGAYGWRLLGIQLHIYTPLAKPAAERGHVVAGIMAHSVASVFLFAIVRHLYHYVKLQQVAKQLRIEKQEAELNYLKSQTNPHFLFNTLNNIYSLTRDKSDLAPESLLRLSKILRFMLYETGGEYILIEQEIKIVSDYIALEKLRYDESLEVNFNYDIEDMKQALPPLLLIPLVENAFKHGVAETRNHPFVDIHLTVKDRQLTFVVKNSSDGLPGEQSIKENIGLSNLRRQLQLLYKDYDLSVQQNEAIFSAALKINLASHV